MKINSIKKLSRSPWLNLFEADIVDGRNQPKKWIFASRRETIPVTPDKGEGDAVVIVPVHIDELGVRRLVVIKEFRVPIRDFEIAFPAGLNDPGDTPEDTARNELRQETGLVVTKILRKSPAIYSSAGMSDESTIIIFVECTGELSTDYLEGGEEIIPMSLDWLQLRGIYSAKGLKFGAKCWPIIDAIIQRGEI